MHHSAFYYFFTIMTFCVGHQLTDSEQQKKNSNNNNNNNIHLNVNAMDATKERDLNEKTMSSSHDEKLVEPTPLLIKNIGVTTDSWETVSTIGEVVAVAAVDSDNEQPSKPTFLSSVEQQTTAQVEMTAVMGEHTHHQPQQQQQQYQVHHNRTRFVEANNNNNNNRKHHLSAVSKPTLASLSGLQKSHKSEAPLLNQILESHPIFSKHYHHDFRYGPHFENDNITNITVQVGNTFYLNCRISLLQDKTVSWVQRRAGENELQLLTVGKQTYSGDPRYQIEFQYPNNWRLKIVEAVTQDEGVYECQVSTHPPRIITYNLFVNAAPEVTIIDEQGTPLLDKYYEVDSTIRLMCVVRHVSMLSSVVYWSHGDTILNFDVSRGGISVKTDLREEGANSTLFVARINKSDSGNYSCSIPKSNRYTVTVHVLNEESLAELHHSCALYSWLHTQQQLYQNVCITIVLIVFYSFNFAVR